MHATEEISAPVEQPPGTPEDTSAAGADQDWSGESGATRDKAERNAAINDWMRGSLSVTPTSKPDESNAAGEPTPAEQNGQTGAVKPATTSEKRPPRRGVPEAVKSAEQRIADLEAQLAERDPEKLREQWESERQAEQVRSQEQARLDELAQTQRANVERYRRLIETPDAQLSGEDYAWREEFKEKLAAFPDVQQFYAADTARRIESARTAHTESLRSALSQQVSLPGVDAEAFRQMTDWGAMGQHLYEAGARSKQTEIDRLSAENRQQADEIRQLRMSGNGGLGAARGEPPPAGRSSATVPRDHHATMNDWLRGA